MPLLLKMPSLSPTMETGVVAQFHKQVGQYVEVGEVFAEIETDKAVMEYEVADEGYVRVLLAQPGAELPVGAPLAVLADSLEEDLEGFLKEAQNQAVPDAAASAAPASNTILPDPPVREAARPPVSSTTAVSAAAQLPQIAPLSSAPSGAVAAASEVRLAEPPARALPSTAPQFAASAEGLPKRSSPYARKLAQAKGVRWETLIGSGPTGRVIARDVETAQPTSQSAAASGTSSDAPDPTLAMLPQAMFNGQAWRDVPFSMMRRAIARRMLEAKTTVPHFQVRRKVRVEHLLAARAQLLKDFPEYRISINDILIKACAMALIRHPVVNSQNFGDYVREFAHADIAVAVATPDGLLTPVLCNAELKGILALSVEMRELARQARERKLPPEKYSGGSFSISNLGMYGVDEFQAIVNIPQTSILAVSAVVEEPVVEQGELAVGKTMNLVLSADHRVVDGAAAAEFMATLVLMLSNPLAMLL